VAIAPSTMSTNAQDQASSDRFPQPILTLEQRTALRVQWKQIVADHTAKCRAWSALKGAARCLARKPELSPYVSLLYAVLLGRDWRKGFTPIRNTRKLANGTPANWAFWQAATYIPDGDHLSRYESPAPPAYLGVLGLFLPSVPLQAQTASLRRLPTLPRWTEGMTAEQLEALWPKAPYQEEPRGEVV
jgi:hypothetical protein